MLSQWEVPAFIASKLPQVKKDLTRKGNELSIYQSIQVLTDYTKKMALEHEFKMVQQCMSLVEKIYERGNTLVRNAIENVFIFSFSSMLSRCNIVEWRIVQSYMPANLYGLYVKQILSSKC
ncbi:MAG TPA: hypothetical protein VGM30_23160 [Puia sp.]|jgi:hypothetical protein